jgi:hypothetical protein
LTAVKMASVCSAMTYASLIDPLWPTQTRAAPARRRSNRWIGKVLPVCCPIYLPVGG